LRGSRRVTTTSTPASSAFTTCSIPSGSTWNRSGRVTMRRPVARAKAKASPEALPKLPAVRKTRTGTPVGTAAASRSTWAARLRSMT
jgi:hypothetical protein